MLDLLILGLVFFSEAHAFMGGNAVKSVNDYPYACSIRKIADGEHWCMCTLISDKWALTTADCLIDYPRWDLEVVLGMVSQKRPEYTKESHQIKTYIIHENYTLGGKEKENLHNVGLIELEAPVKFAEFRSAQLDKRNMVLDDCRIVSYGNDNNDCVNIWRICPRYTKSECINQESIRKYCQAFCNQCNPRIGDQLQETAVNIPPSPRCDKDMYTGSYITKDQICAINTKLMLRYGDDAAPLVCKTGQEDVVIGLLSLNDMTMYKDNSGIPGVFIKLQSYHKWINELTGL